MLLLKGDKLRLHDDRIVEVIDSWGFTPRNHAKVKSAEGEISYIIAENDVSAILQRTAIRKSKFKEW